MIIFGSIMVISFVVLIFMLAVGEIGEHATEFAHDVAVDHHDIHLGHHDGDVNHQSGPSIFSVRFLAAFGTGFGGGGCIGRYFELGYFGASLIGLGIGVAVAGLLYIIVSALYKLQGSGTVSVASLVGKTALVRVAIPAGGTGEVTLTSKGATVVQFAKTEDGLAVEQGMSVTIKAVAGDYVIVE